jgi:hypothetical protein
VDPSQAVPGPRRTPRWLIASAVVCVLAAVVAVTVVIALGDRTGPREQAADAATTDVAEIRAAADALRSAAFQVDFTFTWKDPDMPGALDRTRPVRWTGTMRTTGGGQPRWALSSQAHLRRDDGSETRLDAVTIVDDERSSYYDTLNTTFEGKEWAAVTGPKRVNNYWRPPYRDTSGSLQPAGPVRVPDVDPLEYLDIDSARDVNRLDLSDGRRAYQFTSLDPGLDLGARTARAVEPFNPGGFRIDVDLDPAGRLVGVTVRTLTSVSGQVLTLAVRDAGTPVTVDVPPPGTYAEAP